MKFLIKFLLLNVYEYFQLISNSLKGPKMILCTEKELLRFSEYDGKDPCVFEFTTIKSKYFPLCFSTFLLMFLSER